MAKFIKETTKQDGGTELIRYKQDGNYVAFGKVPTNVVNALDELKEGTAVDELGDFINPETDTDESEDEDTPDQDENAEDTSDSDEEDQEPAPKKKRTRKNNNPDVDIEDDNEVPQDEEGMGFKRVNGKTVDIFDSKTPHVTVRNVAGLMVPLSQVSAFGDPKKDVEPKTDAEIIEKLKKLGKL